MTLQFEVGAALPRLSWCARVRQGGIVLVRHGADVECRGEGFVEGAWDGDFDAFDFDRAESLAGSGARLRDGQLVFVTPFHPLEGIFVLRLGSETLLSNSLVFLLTEAGEALDLSYPNYYIDVSRGARAGIERPVLFRTASGKVVEWYRVCQLTVKADGTVHHRPKPLGPPPQTFADYFGFLDRTTKTLADNALSPSRRRTYRLVAACSRGYDSTASAALAARAGCREGLTMVNGARTEGHPLFGAKRVAANDSGTDTLRALGMRVHEFERTPIARIPGFEIAEFYFGECPTDPMTHWFEDLITGGILVSGRHGERYWGPTTRCARKQMREVDDCMGNGYGLPEFRLRAGFIHYPPPYVGALHGPAIHRITHLPEMLPWKLGKGYYDRPIPRRIAEEQGVPRDCFGQQKMGGPPSNSSELNDESLADFQRFVEAHVPENVRRQLDYRSRDARWPKARKIAYLRTHYAHLPGVDALLNLLGTDRMNVNWNSVRLYKFHWGFSKLTDRYRS